MFLDCLKQDREGKAGFSCLLYAKLEHRFVGSAGKRIGRKLRSSETKERPHASAIVMGEKGRLKKGLKRRLGR